MRRRTVVGLVVLALGCGREAAPPPVSGANAPLSAEDTDRLFGERVNAGDVDGVVALYEPNATLVRQDGTPAQGSDAIRTEIAAFIAQKPHITLNITSTLKGGGDLAVLYNDWIATGIDAAGKPASLSGRAVEVVRKQADGTWRFVVDAPNARTLP